MKKPRAKQLGVETGRRSFWGRNAWEGHWKNGATPRGKLEHRRDDCRKAVGLRDSNKKR